jgi:hypothetical protein
MSIGLNSSAEYGQVTGGGHGKSLIGCSRFGRAVADIFYTSWSCDSIARSIDPPANWACYLAALVLTLSATAGLGALTTEKLFRNHVSTDSL